MIKIDRRQNILFNICIAVNSLLVILLIFESRLQVPVFLQVAGRMHPLLLHFPVVLLLLSFFTEIILSRKHNNDLVFFANWLLLLTACSAGFTAVMGLLLSKEDGYDADILASHKWWGVAVAFISLLWYGFRNSIRKKKLWSVLVGAPALAAVIIAGHEGAGITHGENFLMAPAQLKQEDKPAVALEEAVIFTNLVQPVLETKCISCHNDKKAKGGLILDSKASILLGGKHGKLWDSTDLRQGLLLHRINLPTSEKMHMPPVGKPQLTEQEVNILTYWIAGGASFTKKVIELPETDSLRVIAAAMLKTNAADSYDFAAANAADIQQLNNDYRVIKPVALNSPALRVDFFGKPFYTTDRLKELAVLKDNIVILNLANMPVTDEDVKQISAFTNLQQLNLSFTKITGAALMHLSVLKKLKLLSLSGNALSLRSLDPLRSITGLNELYLWQTGIADNDITALKKTFPKTAIQNGFNGAGVAATLSHPVIQTETQVFTNSVTVKVKHYMKNVILRYTTDGTDPDSVQSLLYKDGIVLNNSATVKVKAFLPGWIGSTVTEKSFYRTGYLADSVKLVTPPYASYAAGGGKTLADGEKGDLNFRVKWLGYKDNDLLAYLYFKQPVLLSSISISGLVDIGNYIMPPQQIEIWGGKNAQQMQLIKKITPQQPQMQGDPYLTGFDCSFAKQEISVVKIIVKPVAKLPAWHRGKGERGWAFVDEIFFN